MEQDRAHRLANEHVIIKERFYMQSLWTDYFDTEQADETETIMDLIEAEEERLYYPSDSAINLYEDRDPPHGDTKINT